MSTHLLHLIGPRAIQQGKELYLPLAPQDARTGARLDLTGWSATWTLYGAPATLDSLHDAAPIRSWSSAGGIVEVGAFTPQTMILDTVISSAASAGATSLTLSDDTGLAAGDYMGVWLDGDPMLVQTVRIVSIDGTDPTVVTISDPLVADASALNPARTWREIGDGGTFGVYGALINLTNNESGTLDVFGLGVHILDLVDPYGHVQYRVRGIVALEEGTRHG